MTKIILFCIALIVGLTWSAPTARAASILLTPSIDTTVKKSAPDTSFSNAPTLDMLYDSGTDPNAAPTDVNEALIKFDLSSIPSGKFITSAKLTLSAYGSSNFGYSDIRLRRASVPWDNSTTWNSRPSYSSDSEANLEVPSNQFPESITITNVVQDWYKSQSTNNGLVIRAYGDGDYSKGLFTGQDAHVSSAEGVNPPRLVVEYSNTAPTPSPTPSVGTASTTKPDAQNSTSTNGTGSDQTGSTQSQNGAPISPISISIEPCIPQLTQLIVTPSGTTATIAFMTTNPVIGRLYYYKSSKVLTSETAHSASNYDQGSIKFGDSDATLNHSFAISDLTPNTRYFFTILAGNSQECEHAFTTARDTNVVQLIGQGTGKKPGGQTRDSFTKRVSALLQPISSMLLGNKPITSSESVLLGMAVLSFLVLGRFSLKGVMALYNFTSQLPNWWLARVLPKKTRSTWGRVLSALNMSGIKGAIIAIYNNRTGQIVDRTSSDEHGLYGFIVEPGTYRLTVSHSRYTFPSQLMPYSYQGAPLKVESLDGVVSLDLPMDPSVCTRPIYQRLEVAMIRLELLRLPLLIVGTTVSLYSLISDRTPLNVLMALFFLAGLAWEYKRRNESRYLLRFTDDSGKPVPFAQVQVKNKRGQIALRYVTNQNGVITAFVPAGQYDVQVVTLTPEHRSVRQTIHKVEINRGIVLKESTLTLKAPLSV